MIGSLQRLAVLFGFLVCARLLAVDVEWFDPPRHADEVRQGSDCAIAADRRIFAVMAFINAAGFDEESNGATMHPARVRVRELVAKNLAAHPGDLARWRELYRRVACSSSDYIEWAITLSADHPFRRVGPDSVCYHRDVPEKLRELPTELNRFWELAKLGEVRADVLPLYREDLARYDLAAMNAELDEVWRFLRMPRREGRTMLSVPNLLDRHFNACSIPCGKFFVSIEGPGSHSYGLNVHEYLHEIVNSLAREHFDGRAAVLQAYFELWRKHPKSRGYEAPVDYVQECLVRALDAHVVAHLHPERAEVKRAEVQRSVEDGLVLTGVFFAQLADFAKGEEPFDRYVAALLARTPAS